MRQKSTPKNQTGRDANASGMPQNTQNSGDAQASDRRQEQKRDAQASGRKQKPQHDTQMSDRRQKADPARKFAAQSEQTDASAQKKQRFIKNNQYFTICIYAGVMVLIAAIIFKCVLDIDKTKAWLRQMIGMLSPFILGALLAYVLNPMVSMFSRGIDRLCGRLKLRLKHGLHAGLSILITYLIVIGFVVLTLLYVFPEITKNLIDFVNYLPTAYNTVLDMLARLQKRFPNLEISLIRNYLADAMPELASYLQNFATNMVPALYTISMSVVDWIVNLFITLIVSIYMLYDKHRIMQTSWRLIYAFLPKKHIPACQEILSECNRLFSSFVVGKFIDSLIIGFLCFILMSILRLPYTLLISIIVGVTNMIPYFGPFIGAVPGILIMMFISPLQALVFAAMILCLQQFDGLILGPKILGNSTGMKPLWIIFAITIGGNLAGLIGMFLGVPVVAILSYLFDRYLSHRLSRKNISDVTIENALKKMELDE